MDIPPVAKDNRRLPIQPATSQSPVMEEGTDTLPTIWNGICEALYLMDSRVLLRPSDLTSAMLCPTRLTESSANRPAWSQVFKHFIQSLSITSIELHTPRFLTHLGQHAPDPKSQTVQSVLIPQRHLVLPLTSQSG